MCNEITEKTKYKIYNNVVSTIMTNILIERERNGFFLLYNFNPNNEEDKLYFNITAIAADLRKENIFLNISLFNFLKFKFTHRKRKNLKWFSLFKNRKLNDEFKIDISTLMNFISEQLNISSELFEMINKEYYGGK